MNQYITSEIKNKYGSKPLIVPNYASRDKEYYTVSDLISMSTLVHMLSEVNNHEADITIIGMAFLKDAFGLDNLAHILYSSNWHSDEYKSPNEILEWLNWWNHEVSNKTI